MNRLLLVWLSLAVIVLLTGITACQPIRPEAELTPAATNSTGTDSASTAITSTATITDTAPITTSSELTTTTEMTATTPSTSTAGITSSTPSTPSEGTSEAATSCPALVDQPLDILISANWEEGDQRTYLVTQSQSEVTDGEESVALAVTTPITITVLNVDDDGYVLEWSFGKAEFGETDIVMPDPLQNLMQTPLEVVFKYSTDIDGVYVELLNVEELQEQIEPLIDQIFETMIAADDTLTEEAIDAAREMVDNIFADPANFDALFTREVQLFHTLYGFYFESAEPLILPDLRPNMLGGPPIPSELTVTPTHYDAGQGCLHVAFENIADPVEARNSILESLQEQARQMGVPGPDEDDLPGEMELVDNIRFEMDIESGWPTAIYLERVTNFGPQGRIETAEVVLVEEDTE